MTLRTMLGFSDAHLIEGTTDGERAAHEEQVRQARLVAARRNSKWTEIEDDFVSRGRGLFVSAASDHVYAAVRGIVFATASVTIIADQSPLYFVVGDNGELAFYERQPRTWTEMLERKAERERRRNAPKSRPRWMDAKP